MQHSGRLELVVVLLQALRAVHFPANMSAAEAGRRRLAFDELFLLQLKLLLKRALQRCHQQVSSPSQVSAPLFVLLVTLSRPAHDQHTIVCI
jgi:RecG-like helicase